MRPLPLIVPSLLAASCATLANAQSVVGWGGYGFSNIDDMSSIVQVAGGFTHSIARKSDGTVVCFGDGSSATGATASRTYAAAGTSTVLLFCANLTIQRWEYVLAAPWTSSRAMRVIQESQRDRGYITDLISDYAVEFIGKQKGPFLLSVHYTAPHWPWETRDDADTAHFDPAGNGGGNFGPECPALDRDVQIVIANQPGAAIDEAQRQIRFTRTRGAKQQHTVALDGDGGGVDLMRCFEMRHGQTKQEGRNYRMKITAPREGAQ